MAYNGTSYPVCFLNIHHTKERGNHIHRLVSNSINIASPNRLSFLKVSATDPGGMRTLNSQWKEKSLSRHFNIFLMHVLSHMNTRTSTGDQTPPLHAWCIERVVCVWWAAILAGVECGCTRYICEWPLVRYCSLKEKAKYIKLKNYVWVFSYFLC